MPKTKTSVNKSEEIRQLLKANPKMPVKEIVSTLAGKGIKVANTLVYFVKGHMKGRKGRRRKARQMVGKVNSDPVATIVKIKSLASEVGGLRQLKALVDALSE
jgi:hypothetical protein